MNRYLGHLVAQDLQKKLVFLVGPRQVGKTTLARALQTSPLPGENDSSQARYLNFDVAADRDVIQNQQWSARCNYVVLDELHKMAGWKNWLKGVADARPPHQRMLVTGSARLDTFRQTGDSLAGRFFSWRLHPISVREWCAHTGTSPDAAVQHLLQRGGFPEPCLAATQREAMRWRKQYIDGLVRDDVLEFSRLKEVRAMRLFVDMLRERVGSPLSLASIARDLQIAPTTLAQYLDILQALFIVFVVRPWSRNIARATLKSPKVYFFDTGLVEGDEGVRFENLVACHLLKHAEFLQDSEGRDVGLHYIRTKDDAEVDFCLSDGKTLSSLIECKLADTKPHRALQRFAAEQPHAQAVQLLRDLRGPHTAGLIQFQQAGPWLGALAA